MRTTSRLAGALVVAVLAAGCKSSGGDKPAAGKPADKPVAAAKKEEAKPATPAPAPKPEPRAPGTMSAQDRALLDDMARDRARREEMRKFLVSKYLEMGDDLYKSGEWEMAREKFAEALQLEPGNATAARRLEEIGAHLNERGPTAADSFEDARRSRMVKMEQAKLEVENYVRTGRRAEADGKWDDAIASYEKALVIVAIQPYQVDFTPDADGLRKMIAAGKDRKRGAEQASRQKEFEEARRIKEAEAAREKSQMRATIHTLFRDANAAMEEERYQVARDLAEKVLEIDPTNRDADRLRALAERADAAATHESIRRSTREEWKRVFEELQQAAIPEVETVAFPKTWALREGRREAPALSTAATFAADAREGAIMATLESVRVPELVIDGQTKIHDVLNHLANLTGLNFVLDGKATENKTDADLVLPALRLQAPTSVKEILTIITESKSLRWKVSNGVVLVTTPEEARGKNILDLYDVKDITAGIKDFPADDINLTPSGGSSFTLPADEGAEPRKTFEGEALKDLIQNNVDKEVWTAGGGAIDYREPGTLVVKAPASTHAKVRKILSDLRNTAGMQVSIETRFITVADNFLQDIGVDLRGLGDDSLGGGLPGKGTRQTFDDVLSGTASAPAGIGTGNDAGVFYNFIHGSQDLRARVENLYDVALGKPGVLTPTGGTAIQATYLDDTQVEAILRAVEKSERSTLVIAPSITAYNNERANVQVLNQVSYIADFDVEIAQLAQIGDPIIQQLRDGVILDIHPIISADRRYVTMELRPTVAVLQRPIQTFQTTLANGPPVAIQLPELRIQRVRTTVTVPDGGTLLLGGLKFYEEQRLDSTVPWLDKIPVLNFFWRRQGTYIERRNLLILLKASIIRLEEHEPRMGRRG